MIKFLNVNMITRNQLVALLAMVGLLSTVVTGTTPVFARTHSSNSYKLFEYQNNPGIRV
ncbi:MAG: hypothetical protein WBZ36_05745 [Candidatus Nitrosopolaris sp.]